MLRAIVAVFAVAVPFAPNAQAKESPPNVCVRASAVVDALAVTESAHGDGEILAVMDRGTQVIVQGPSSDGQGKWVRVRAEGVGGHVHLKHLEYEGKCR
ncbi:hypothetical protein CKO28_24090 [Rhodovibrio sodomensis]|uniref:SH3 domain-containing protein n=1 Tax=Rhodovibrio sodomensis TaxID=1088 RepID=A0ABS1DMD4_9PROT|nr:hypothetical protein [Rhodovibrio sodomensis]